jgi:hypothetical protein
MVTGRVSAVNVLCQVFRDHYVVGMMVVVA